MIRRASSFVSRAFSLVEMLVVLITVSIIMAAMTPVMTKKLKSNEITIGSKNSLFTSECSEKYSNSCKLCDSKNA